MLLLQEFLSYYSFFYITFSTLNFYFQNLKRDNIKLELKWTVQPTAWYGSGPRLVCYFLPSYTPVQTSKLTQSHCTELLRIKEVYLFRKFFKKKLLKKQVKQKRVQPKFTQFNVLLLKSQWINKILTRLGTRQSKFKSLDKSESWLDTFLFIF